MPVATTIRLLLVEDHPALARNVVEFLEPAGARNGIGLWGLGLQDPTKIGLFSRRPKFQIGTG